MVEKSLATFPLMGAIPGDSRTTELQAPPPAAALELSAAAARCRPGNWPIIRGEVFEDPVVVEAAYERIIGYIDLGFPNEGKFLLSMLPNDLDPTSQTNIIEVHNANITGVKWATIEFNISECVESLFMSQQPISSIRISGRVRSVPHFETHGKIYIRYKHGEGKEFNLGYAAVSHTFAPFQFLVDPVEADLLNISGGDADLFFALTLPGSTWFSLQVSDLVLGAA